MSRTLKHPLVRAGIVLGMGFGGFADGIVLHRILGIHHVLPGHPHQFWFDMLFLAAGVVLLVIGARFVRSPGSATD